eukprot:4216669-Pleurochrysis_carterae.AAC.2
MRGCRMSLPTYCVHMLAETGWDDCSDSVRTPCAAINVSSCGDLLRSYPATQRGCPIVPETARECVSAQVDALYRGLVTTFCKTHSKELKARLGDRVM